MSFKNDDRDIGLGAPDARIMPSDVRYPQVPFPELSPAPVVLCVDNSAHHLEWLNQLVRDSMGGTAHTATNGAEALNVLAGHPEIDCVITDILRQETTDGIWLLEHIRTNRTHDDLPVLMYTETDPSSMMGSAVSRGVDFYIPKRCGRDVLQHAITYFTAKSRRVRALQQDMRAFEARMVKLQGDMAGLLKKLSG